MNRREALKSAGRAAIAAGLARPISADAGPSQATASLSPTPGDLLVRTPDGQHLAVQDWGSGNPIVFLAAWALPSDMWVYQMVPLSERGFRTVAFDRRGHGRSSRPGTGYDFDTLADDVAAVLDALDLRNVTLVGMSMAGGEMVRYVTRYGTARLARLVFVATASTPFLVRTPDNPAGIPADRFELFRQQMLLRDYPKWLEDNRAAFFLPETSPQMQEWVRTMMLGTSLKALIECHRSLTATDFRRELPKIDLPALVIHGDKDASAPLDLTGRPTARLLPSAQLTIYEGAPHGLFVTHQDRLNADR
jgi:non-heme chloroperoxidase